MSKQDVNNAKNTKDSAVKNDAAKDTANNSVEQVTVAESVAEETAVNDPSAKEQESLHAAIAEEAAEELSQSPYDITPEAVSFDVEFDDEEDEAAAEGSSTTASDESDESEETNDEADDDYSDLHDDDIDDDTDDEDDDSDEVIATANGVDEEAMAVSHKLDHELTGRRSKKLDNSVFRSYPLFALNNVSLTDKKSGAEVLDNISFRCDAGKSYGVLVPNDAPLMHTMLLSVMSGMTLPTTGHVMTKSTSLAELAPLEIRGYRIGLMTQQFAFRPDLDAESNLLYAMDASNRNFLQPKPIVARELLQHVGFGTHGVDGKAADGNAAPVATKGVKLKDLSVMDQLRVAVARAISRDPDIVIADEPTAALNDDDAAAILDLLKKQVKAHSKKRTVIVVTSNPDVAKQMGSVIDLRN